MKIICISAGNPERMHALPLLDSLTDSGYEPHLVLDKDPGIPIPESVIVHHHALTGLTQFDTGARRQWAEDRLIRDGEMYVIIDDNVKGANCLDPNAWDSHGTEITEEAFHKDVFHPAARWEIVEYLRNMRKEMLEHGALMGAFALEENKFFRRRRYTSPNYCRTQIAMAVKDPDIKWTLFPGVPTLAEDLIRSVQCVVKTGSVVVDRWLKAEKVHFEAGGIGSLEERKPVLTQVMNHLEARFPGLMRRQHPWHCVFAKRGRSLETWRRDFLRRYNCRGELL